MIFVSSHQIHEVALAFRLLRQGGYHVNSDLFDNLKCSKNIFSVKYGEDVKGFIALYEASQLSIEGEVSLNDLGYLCLDPLQAWLLRHHDHDEARYVSNTLQYPIHYCLSRFMDKSIFINYLNAKNEWNSLDVLAKINSNIVRLMNQNEIIEVSRWEMTGTTNLPNFMKITLSALYKVTNDFSEMVYKKHGFNPIDTLKKSWVRLLNAFLKEAIWLNCGHLARADEYLDNGIVSTGVHVVLIHAFFLLDHVQVSQSN
ncbi:hypothetical protein TSUD_53470 [Trifolium subterraneum]|uniref:Terpene synthase metal-binding domain-containing protein n=1 Tax=Trifolium subterraneum TaxID=3900 RepID=A0A2Z6MJ21_TRISU|nr:hypothetical protein TSUD_53470 [Trifolium subterraneum]